MRLATMEPLKIIAQNAGMDGGVVVEKVRTLGPGEGLNAASSRSLPFLSGNIPERKAREENPSRRRNPP